MSIQKLSDFKPLETLALSGVGNLRCNGLTVIVGPNSSGKSQLLLDIYKCICGELRQLVVAEAIQVAKPPYEEFIECLEAEGLFQRELDTNGNVRLKPTSTYLGTGDAISILDERQARNWYNEYSNADMAGSRPVAFRSYFGKGLVTGLFLDRRLQAVNGANAIDFQTTHPQHDFHALYLNDSARAALLTEFQNTFNKAIWPDCSRVTVINLRLAENSTYPSAEDRLSYQKMAAYRTIESEGDGVKSYAAICIALLLGRRPICLIDEPEMCLHPPQAHSLGQFIGRNASSPETATFVSTHSSHVLRGILQSGSDVQIVRLSRHGVGFKAHHVPTHVLKEVIAKPTLRSEFVLDGIFSQSVVIVEADGDRLVYQTVLETLNQEIRKDIHFTAVGGIGAIADTCDLYRRLNIPVAVIADLDLICDPHKLGQVITALGSDPLSVKARLAEARKILAEIRKTPPSVEEADVIEELQEMSSLTLNWDSDDDIRLAKRLSNLANRLNRIRKLKRGGINAFFGTAATELSELVNSLKQIGLYLVPVGELEGWLEDAGLASSKENKWAWASEASDKIQASGCAEGDVWDFMRQVAQFFTRE